MKTKIDKIVKRLICMFFGHKLFRTNIKVGYKTEIVGCNRCKNYYGMNHDMGAILPFSKEMYEMYKRMGHKGLKKYISDDRFFNLITG